MSKCPALLDVVHHLIEKRKNKFYSYRFKHQKLKRGNANLLAGRAFEYSLYSLTANEIG